MLAMSQPHLTDAETICKALKESDLPEATQVKLGFSFLICTLIHSSFNRCTFSGSYVPGTVRTGASRVSDTNTVSARTKLRSHLFIKAGCFSSVFTVRKRESSGVRIC